MTTEEALPAAWKVGVVLLGLGAIAVPFAGEVLRRLPRRVPVFFARWGFSHVLVAALSALGTTVLLGALTGALAGTPAGVEGADPALQDGAAAAQPGILVQLYLTMGILGAGVAYAAYTARRLHPEGIGALGLATGGNVRAIVAGALAYPLLLPGVLGVAALWPPIAEALGFEVGPQEVLSSIRGLEGAALVQAIVLAVVVGPFLEEALFRGFLQPLLVQNLRELGGIAVTSALFAALHGASAFAPLFALSMLLGYVQLRTQRLGAAWFVHGLHNGLTLAIVLLVPEWYDALEATT